jgi:hypothetical protein
MGGFKMNITEETKIGMIDFLLTQIEENEEIVEYDEDEDEEEF